MEIDLVARLCANPAIAAIVGDRVSFLERPQSAGFHCITLTKVSPGRDYTHSGADGLDGPRVQADYWGSDDMLLLTLRNEVRIEMESPDPITGKDVGSTRFWPAELEGEQGLTTEYLSDQTPIRRMMDDFQFHHEAI